MIQHEITICKFEYLNPILKTLNRDFKSHREEGLPARRWWYSNGTLRGEGYSRNGKRHREDGPAWRWWHSNGNLKWKLYYLEGEEYDPT
jgi:hypothetical protein